MDIEYAKQKVAKIERCKGDPEVAHSIEDQLYFSFAELVAECGPPELSEIAEEILKTDKINFPRWCA